MKMRATQPVVKKHDALILLAVGPNPHIALCTPGEPAIEFHSAMLLKRECPRLQSKDARWVHICIYF